MSRNISILESQQENAHQPSLDITGSLERFGTVETPDNFHFFGALQQAMRNQQLGHPQPWLSHQPGFNEMHLRQQHLMYKQMQELHRQQHLQQCDEDARQQNSFSSLSAIVKQGSSNQQPSLINGVPIHDASSYIWPSQPLGGDFRIPSTSPLLMSGNANWVSRSASPAMQGFPSGFISPREQSQMFHSMTFPAQQLDQSLYGAPVATTRGPLNQFPHFQGISNDNINTFTKAIVNQFDKPVAQSTSFNAFQNDQSPEFPNQAGMSEGVSVSRQGFQRKNLFGHAPMQNLQSDILRENFQQVNSMSRDLSMQERLGWEGNLQEKVAAQGGSSKDLVPLDPTEAKILFDSDEGVWDNSFTRTGGRNAGGFIHGNQLEGTDYLNGFPSVQSGSWSALMQSAVAETSSCDTGLKYESSSLSFHKTELSNENCAMAMSDSSKHPTAWGNNMQMCSSIASGPFRLFGDSDIGQVTHSDPEHQSPSNESFQQSPKENSRCLDHNQQQKPLVDGIYQVQTAVHTNNVRESAWGHHIHEQTHSKAQSMDIELNSQNIQKSWSHPHGIVPYNIGSQSGSTINGFSINESFPSNKKTALKTIDHEQSTQHALTSESCEDAQVDGVRNGLMNRNGDDIAALPLTSSSDQFEQKKSGAGSPQVLQNHQHDYEKHAMFDTSMYRNSESVGEHHNDSSQSLHIQDSSSNANHRNSGETYNKKMADSYMSAHAVHFTGDGVKGNAHSVANDTRLLFSGNQNAVRQRDKIGTEELPSRSFHPEYDSVASSSFDRLNNFHSQNRRTIQPSQNMLELLHKVDQCSSATAVGSSVQYQSEMCEGTAPNRSITNLSHIQSLGSQGFGLQLGPPSQRVSTSNLVIPYQTCLQTADEHEGNSHGAVTPDTSFPSNPSMRQHMSDASGQVPNHNNNHSFPSQADMDAMSRFVSNVKEVDDTHDESQLSKGSFPGTANRSLPFSLAPTDATASIPSAFPPHSSASHLINVNSSCARGSGQHSTISQLPVSSGTSHGGFSSMLQNVWTNVTSQQRLPSGISSKVPPSDFQSLHLSNKNLDAAAWTSRKSDVQIVNRMESSPCDFRDGSINSPKSSYREEQPIKGSSLQQVGHERMKIAAEPSDSFQEPVHLPHQDLGRGMPGSEQSLNSHIEHASLHYSDSSNSELDSFSRAMKSSGEIHRKYSLLNQVQAMKDAESDTSRKSGKRLKGADYSVDAQEPSAKSGQWFTYGFNKVVRDSAQAQIAPSSQCMQFPVSDPKVLSFSSDMKENQNADASPLDARDASSSDIAISQRSDLQNQSRIMGVPSTFSLRFNENSRINPQMAPSWFERYGAFKADPISAMSNGLDGSRRDVKMVAQQFVFGKIHDSPQGKTSVEQPNARNATQSSSIRQISTDMVQANVHLPSSLSLPPAIDPGIVVAITKKRKSTSGLLPWHKEISQSSQRLQSISMAEVDWAQATNRLVEKVEDGSEIIEDRQAVSRPRRRLVLTTQLMQKIFCSIPAAILSADASFEFESLVYFTAKSALGDACSLLACLGSDRCAQSNGISMISGQARAFERAGDQSFAKIVEVFMSKARTIESDLSRLDRSSSILDVRVECQELEKVSIINRFARFHGRGNVDEVEGSSNDVITRKSSPQRYVMAVALPTNFPDGVPCLSL